MPTDPSAERLQWTITGAQGQEPTAVRFNPAPPPDETTGSTAIAMAEVDAVHAGDNFINVVLLNSNGDVIDGFSIEKQVHAATPVKTLLTIRKLHGGFRGKAKAARPECRRGRRVTLYRRHHGRVRSVGSILTSSKGRWRLRRQRRRGTYYARVPASTKVTQAGGRLSCLAARSRRVRRT